MPHISGLEFCQVVRNDRRWAGARFAVAMYGMTYDEGVSRLSKLQKTLERKPLSLDSDRS